MVKCKNVTKIRSFLNLYSHLIPNLLIFLLFLYENLRYIVVFTKRGAKMAHYQRILKSQSF